MPLFTTYPFSIHREGSPHDPGYHIGYIGRNPEETVIFSNKCKGSASDTGGPCERCEDIWKNVDWVRSSKACMKESYDALEATRAKTAEDLQDTTLKDLNLRRDFARAERDNENYERIINTIIDNAPPAVPRILRTCRNHGDGLPGTLKRLEAAANGQYTPRGYSADDIDLGVVFYELGGKGTVYAANHSHIATPAIQTIERHRRPFYIRVSVGEPKVREVKANIATTAPLRRSDAEIATSLRRMGFSLDIDELTSDGRPVYLPRTDQLGGTCREHSGRLPTLTIGDDIKNIQNAADAVRKGEVHIGKEFTTVAICPHSRTHYGAQPILLSPTCKHGTAMDQVRLIRTCLKAWRESECGEQQSGPIWSIASDGDATRRAALYILCMDRHLNKQSALYQRVGELRGLNLYVGEGNITMDFDFKHIWKRICSLICSRQGLLVNDRQVNKQILALRFEALTQYDWTDMSIHALLSPKDPQDVPRAYALLSRIADLRKVDTSEFNPTDKDTHDVLSLFGELLHCLLEAFTNVELDLSEAVTHLVCFAHLTCALYCKNDTSFMPNQLYSDIQCMVKNVVFTVAKAQELDPESEVHMPLFGTDELEKFFGLLRMLGGHHPNLDLAEIAARCRSVLNLQDVFRRHPEWEKMPTRLKIQRTRDFDHLSPRDWKKDHIAAHCDLASCWNKGVERATDILRRHNITMDFRAFFSRDGIDLMRPNGSPYPGVSKEYDRSAIIIGSSGEENDAQPGKDGSAADGETPTQVGEPAVDSLALSVASEPESDESNEPDAPGTHTLDLVVGDKGQRQHKATVIRILFEVDSGFSHDRLLRVRTYWIGGAHWDPKGGIIEGGELEAQQRFSVGGLFATLVRIRGDEIHLAIAQAVFIKRSPTNPCDISATSYAALTDPSSTYVLGGQLLSLVPFCPIREGETSATSPRVQWFWTSDYVALDGAKTRHTEQAVRRKQLVFSVPAALTIPLRSEAREIDIAELPDDCASQILDRKSNKASTWVLSDDSLQRLREELWSRVSPDSDKAEAPLHTAIPTYGEVISGSFPYAFRNVSTGESSTNVSHMAGQIRPAPSKGEAKISCRICASLVAAGDIQNHVGRHILRAKYGVHDRRGSEGSEITRAYPCGFCGGPSSPSGENGTCSVAIVMHGKTPKASSSCSRAYPFKIETASQISKSKPCTNVPLRCPLCQDVHWKYNMEKHLADRHPDHEGRLPDEFLALINITVDEKSRLGIPEDATLAVSGADNVLQRGQKRPASPALSEDVRASKRVCQPDASAVQCQSPQAAEIESEDPSPAIHNI
ncbi:hypothetical protein GGF50DRAFT_88180, partial [Schizophyllum commune]